MVRQPPSRKVGVGPGIVTQILHFLVTGGSRDQDQYSTI